VQVLQLAQQFIALGEAFTRIPAVGLRAHVAKASATFFAAKQHRQLEVLRMMLERELWQVCLLTPLPATRTPGQG
jgi:hypothetical protein